MRIWSPYRNEAGYWFKGNLHSHSSESDGPFSPQELVYQYAARGHRFLAITDHDMVTDVAKLDPCGMILLPGNEITDRGPHVVNVGAKSAVKPDPDRQKALDAVKAQGGLTIMAHPNWESHFSHCPQETLMALEGYTGIEIFNAVVAWLEGNPIATDRWDRLLAARRRVWGFADDDCHIPSDIGVAWNTVLLDGPHPDAGSIMQALKQGSFYASTGVVIESIRAFGDDVSIRTTNAQRISVFSDYGFRRGLTDAEEMTFTLEPDAPFTYFRFECFGERDQRAWTQPFFLERDPASRTR